MFFKSANKALNHKLETLLPEIQEITCSRIANFLTMNISTLDGTWCHSPNNINDQHVCALAYLKCNYKNHVVNTHSIQNIKRIIQKIQKTDYKELKQNLWPSNSKIPDSTKKCFYVYDRVHNFQQLMQCSLMKNKVYNKVLCFPKSDPIKISSSFEKFCLQHNVRALGLTQFSLRSLARQISKSSKNPILLHELLDEDYSIYTDSLAKDCPKQLIIFMNNVKQQKLKTQNFPQLKEILKNYMSRQTFQAKYKTTTPNFTIARLQHILEVEKYSPAIEAQHRALKGQDPY